MLFCDEESSNSSEQCDHLKDHIKFDCMLKFFNKTRLNNVTHLSENEIFIHRTPTIHMLLKQ